MKRKISLKILQIALIFFVSLLLVIIRTNIAFASGTEYEISNFDDLLEAAALSKTSDYQDATFILTSDITISDDNQAYLNENNEWINFGSSELPFSGTFDGQGHVISNLEYSSSLRPRADTGLFSYTDGATIKNLTINNADIDADYRGGVVVGSATNTLIENVKVTNSHLFITAVDNVVTLITDGGVRGGAIAGEASNSVLYNCEVNNTFVNTNSTSGVAALAGKGLTLGALIGKSYSSTVEYSRVTSGTRVSNYYDVAVGAVGGNTLYVGGIVGQMYGTSKVIDSFSMAELYYYCATYVSVGAGNAGHIGGITAAMNGSTNEIHRSHYAGVATSRQYNAVLVIPIIQNNQNISGIADIYDGGSVVSTYFKPSLNPDVNMNVLGDSSSTSSYGPVNDMNYINKDFFQEQSYDFTGKIKRNTEYNSNHYNKWVIDMANGMPIHGKSISATFNFPNSGSVSISPSSLVNSNVTTNNPYKFAVQGYKSSDNLTSISATLNNNYSFNGWYKVSDAYATSLEDDNNFFKDIFDNNNPVSMDSSYSDIAFNDNDLYVARVKAKVVFHDVQGNIINENGEQTFNYEKYYDYLDKLPDVEPATSTTSTFIGWTTIPNALNTGYDGITTTTLNNIKNQGEFYEADDEVTKSLSLYPIYVNLLSNLTVAFEGNELDGNSDATERENVGEANIEKNADDTITLSITGSNNGNLPDGYRFLGWYEDGHRISREQTYTFPVDEIDLTTTHTYDARFEYRVQYYTRAFHQDQNAFSEESLFATRWMRYQEEFENIGTPGFVREYITHWGSSFYDHDKTDDMSDAFSGPITAPTNVYSHNYTSVNGNSAGYRVAATLDFPGSGKIVPEQRTAGSYFRYVGNDNDSDRYHLQFWSFQRSSNNKSGTYLGNPMDTEDFELLGLATTSSYRANAFINTDVIFHKKDGSTSNVTRRFHSNVFLASDTIYTYYYPYYVADTIVDTNTYNNEIISSTVTLEASPSDESMNINGYYFVGWISSTDVAVNSDEWNYIYDVNGDSYTSSNIKKVLPYIVDNNMLVEETMDLYPVYVRYDIETTTNLAHIVTNDVNKPSNPEFTLVKTGDGNGIVTIVPDENTLIKNNEDAKYELDYLSLFIDDRDEEIKIEKDINGEYTYNTVAGSHYKFVANYIPYILTYRLNTNSVETKLVNKNDPAGEQPDPTYTVNSDYLFVGWTSESNGAYYTFESYADYENADLSLVTPSTLVNDSNELSPIYVKNNITVNSNIDTYLDEEGISQNSVYDLKRNNIDTMTLSAKRPKVNNYFFAGWYENYVNNTNPGNLVSTNINYNLNKMDNFSNKVYTAVYKRVYEVKYHNPSGEVFATTYVKEDSNRSFVKNVLDNDNNLVEVPIEDGIYTTIYNYLNKNEYIKQFNYIKEDNTIVEWDDYKNVVITGDMDLYPVIYRITATDSNGNDIDLTTDNARLNTAITKNDFIVKFNDSYIEPSLSIHLDEIQYTRNEPITTGINNKTINLYRDNDDLDVAFTKKTDSTGTTTFTLKEKITLTNTNNNTKNSDDIFIYSITNTSTNVTKKIIIKSNESVELELPYGSYEISEDNNWGWRYKTINENITVDNMSSYEYEFINETVNYDWFDKVTSVNNSFEVMP